VDGVILEVGLWHPRALREQQLERLVELVVRELLAHRRAEKRRASPRSALDSGGELQARKRAARAPRVTFAVGEERGRGGEVGAERVVLRDAVPQQNAVARLEREQLGARWRTPQLDAVDEPDERGKREAALPERHRRRLLGHFVLARALLCQRLEARVDGGPMVARPIYREPTSCRAVGASEDVGDDGVGEGELVR
jgi:hypothetical protein